MIKNQYFQTAAKFSVLSTIAFALFISGGCATNLSTLQTADTVSFPGVRVGAGAGVFVPGDEALREMGPGACSGDDIEDCVTGEYVTMLRNAQAGEIDPIDPEAEKDKIRELFRHAIGLTLYPPAPMLEVSARTGLPGKMDVGLKWTPLSVRGDVKRRLINLGTRGSGLTLAILGAAEYYTYDFFGDQLYEQLENRFDLFDYIGMGTPSRVDGELVLIASAKVLGMISPYAALKYRVGRFDVPMSLTLYHPELENPPTIEDNISGTVQYTGATIGIGMGHRIMRFFGEVTAMQAFATTTILDEEMKLDGLAVYPAVGLAIELP